MQIGQSYYELWCQESAFWPDLPALCWQGGSWSFARLRQEINRLAAGLQTLGVEPGQVVTLYLPNIPQAVAAFYAVGQLGAVANMVHAQLPCSKIAAVLRATHSRVLFCLASSLPGLAAAGVEAQVIFCAPDGQEVDWQRPGYQDYRRLLACGELTASAGNADDPAIYLHSGGTTGLPKTIVLSSRQFNALASQIGFIVGGSDLAGKKALGALPFFHGFGLCLGLHGLLLHGIACVLLPKFHREAAVRLILEQPIHYLLGVPTIFQALLTAEGLRGQDLSCIEGCFAGGDSVTDGLRQAFNSLLAAGGSHAQLLEGYGLTEMVTVCAVNRRDCQRDGSVGQPLPGIRARIWSPEEGRFLPPGPQEGEICLQGPTLMSGYLDDEAATLQALRQHEDGVWLHSGDWGSLDADGFLWFRQRMKRIIKSSGANVFPSQVEACICQLPFVAQACVIGAVNGRGDNGVKAFVTLRQSAERAAAQILDHCRQHLIKWEVPFAIEVRQSLPQTPVGKVDFLALEQEEQRQTAHEGHGVL